MIVKRGEGGYPRIYRPCKVSEVYGQEEARTYIKNALANRKLSNTLLFHGVSGTGKTTLARIVTMALICKKGSPTGEPCGECDSCRAIRSNNHLAYQEFNCARDFSGIEDLREKSRDFNYGSIGYEKKIIVFDECHVLSAPAQTLLNSVLENSSVDNYYVLCTTSLKRILKPLQNRCIEIEFKESPREVISKLLQDVCKWERIKYQYEVLNTIVEKSNGMARNALFLLQKFVELGKVERIDKKAKPEIIDRENGNNVLIIAPHGVYHDDDYTGEIAKHLASCLEGYAVINEKYQKPGTVGFDEPDIEKSLIDLNKLDQIEKYDEVKEEFLAPIHELKQKIRQENGEAIIVLIHGIRDDNIGRVAKKTKKYKRNPNNLHVLIGYGQMAGGKQKLTANENDFIKPLIDALKESGINAAIAPVDKIIDSEGEEKLYCGNDPNGLNQYLRDPKYKTQSIQLEIRNTGFRDDTETARKTAETLGNALSIFLLKKPKKNKITPAKQDKELKANQNTQEPQTTDAELKTEPVQKKVKMDKIQLKEENDWKYIFRFRISAQEDPELKARLDAEIEGLANSIKHDGLAHPLVLIQKKDKKYRILCGYRRYQALRKLRVEEVEAAIYQEGDLTDEQAMRLSLAENTERRDLNDIEIGHFLKSFIENLKWTQERLGREFGESLGFGISHSAVNKRLKLYELWEKRESRDLMLAYLNGEVNFGLISEELISLDDEKDRDALYNSIVKPLRPTKAELHEIKNLLRENGGGL